MMFFEEKDMKPYTLVCFVCGYEETRYPWKCYTEIYPRHCDKEMGDKPIPVQQTLLQLEIKPA